MRINIKAFTLFELIIAITIIALLMVMSYAPYNYYSNKAKVKITAKEISQILYETRNLAIQGVDNGFWNLSFWVYFDSSDTNKNLIQIFSFPYTYTQSQIKPDISDDNIKLYKTYKLLPGIQIDNVDSQDNWLFFFSSIYWSWSYFYYNPSKNNFSNDIIEINFSFKWSDALKSKVDYIIRTNIVDY